MKATLNQLKESYLRLKSVWKVAEEFNMCGQSVHERLKKNKIIDVNFYTENELLKIQNFYKKGFLTGDLKKFCDSIQRPITSVSRVARKLELTNSKRKCNETLKIKMSKKQKEFLKNNPHPKGMKGKTHNEKNRKIISESTSLRWKNLSLLEKNKIILKRMATKANKGTLISKNQKVSWKQSWRTINDKKYYFRSSWEANYGRYLEYLKQNNQIKNWEHEPKTFWFLNVLRGCRSYLPDFKITNLDDSHFWVEVKGYMDEKSVTKLKRFKKYYPEEVLKLIDSKWYSENKKKLSLIIPDWES
jgi:hypothetical protein